MSEIAESCRIAKVCHSANPITRVGEWRRESKTDKCDNKITVMDDSDSPVETRSTRLHKILTRSGDTNNLDKIKIIIRKGKDGRSKVIRKRTVVGVNHANSGRLENHTKSDTVREHIKRKRRTLSDDQHKSRNISRMCKEDHQIMNSKSSMVNNEHFEENLLAINGTTESGAKINISRAKTRNHTDSEEAISFTKDPLIGGVKIEDYNNSENDGHTFSAGTSVKSFADMFLDAEDSVPTSSSVLDLDQESFCSDQDHIAEMSVQTIIDRSVNTDSTGLLKRKCLDDNFNVSDDSKVTKLANVYDEYKTFIEVS